MPQHDGQDVDHGPPQQVAHAPRTRRTLTETANHALTTYSAVTIHVPVTSSITRHPSVPVLHSRVRAVTSAPCREPYGRPYDNAGVDE